MTYFHISSRDDDVTDSWWVRADTEKEARRIVSQNIEAASEAEDSEKFECIIDSTKTPEPGFIYRRLHGPIAIEQE